MERASVPEITGDLKKDVQNLFDAYVKLSRDSEYRMTHIEDKNMTYVGNIALNTEYMFVQMRGGRYIGK